ncbi:hypothetical protein DPMN_045596 [Dreissena polymorpha]|uniref:Uncharacterized protein n=1 Tax=Dreissena polymorpha TaxID=45954 RepID=A0A9D4I026_DREPO|nr:hypothetical protein DPMN_045596 [Dreissena polymorpha]
MDEIGTTQSEGLFTTTIPATTQVVIQAEYIAAVKVIYLPVTYRGTLNVEIRMIKAAPS